MNARVLFVAALMFAAFAVARAEDAEDSALAGIETVEPSFVESDAAAVAVAESETETESESQAVAEAGVDAEAEGFPFKLSKHMRRTTIEPQYYGEPKHKHPRKFVSPEYRDPRARHHRKHPRGLRHNNKDTRPRVFTSHYFAPLPKRVHGKKLALRHDREARRLRHLVPFRATVQTPAGLLMQKKGFQAPEIHPDRRLPNKYDDPRQNMKKTKAPAPLVSLAEVDAEAEAAVEVDTTEQMEAESQSTEAVPPPQFDSAAVGSATQTHAAVVVEDPANFFGDSFTAPTWNEEEATAEEAAAAEEGAEDAETVAVEVAAHSDMSDEEALGHATELEAFLAHAEAGQASFVELNEESEEESDEEAEDEEEADEESEDEEEADEEADEESDEESDEEADEESEEEADEEADEEEIAVALVEVADSEEVEEDEMAQNEEAAKQINMDAVSDEASMTETAVDSDEDSSDAEVDETMEAEIDEDHAVEEVADSEAADEAAALVQADEEVDTLLAEVDAHVASDSDSDAEGEVEAEVEGESSKGTPGASIAAGQTWEDAQMARVDAMEAAMAAEKSSTPKVHATMVSSKAELNVADADMQTPEYNTPEAPRAEMVEPEMLVEKSAQTVLLEKIAKLKAIRRN